MESFNNPCGVHFMVFLILLVAVLVPMFIILCNPLVAALVSSVVVVGCCELGEAYGWGVAGPAYGLLVVFLMAVANSKFSSR